MRSPSLYSKFIPHGKTAVHSISTSVFKGSVLTATHLKNMTKTPILLAKSSLNVLVENSSLTRRWSDSRAARLDLSPVGAVDLIHLGKVGHVGEEHVDLDDILDGGAGGLENGGEILDALVLGGRPRQHAGSRFVYLA